MEKVQIPPKPIKPKVGLNILSCLFLILLGLLAMLLLGSFVVAKTGLLEVPVFSSYYKGPVPMRLLQAKSLSWEDFQLLISKRIYEQRSRAGDSYSIHLTELELTGLLRGVTDGALRGIAWEIVLDQVTISPENLEIYLKAKWHQAVNFDLLFKLKPAISENGTISFEILEARMGDFRLPVALASSLIGSIFGRDLGEWQLNIGGTNPIKSMSLLDRGLNIIIKK